MCDKLGSLTWTVSSNSVSKLRYGERRLRSRWNGSAIIRARNSHTCLLAWHSKSRIESERGSLTSRSTLSRTVQKWRGASECPSRYFKSGGSFFGIRNYYTSNLSTRKHCKNSMNEWNSFRFSRHRALTTCRARFGKCSPSNML